MMWTYEDRDGVIRVADEQEILYKVRPDAAFAKYLDNEFSEIDILDRTYEPSEVFIEWSEDDFARAASEWFNDAIRHPTERNLSYFEEIGVFPATEEDIRNEKVDRGIDRVGKRSAGLRDALGKRGSGTARPKAGGGGMTIRPRAKPKTPVKKTSKAKSASKAAKPKAPAKKTAPKAVSKAPKAKPKTSKPRSKGVRR